MSEEIHYLESNSNAYIPSIESFKRRMQHILLNNKYVAEFGGGRFWTRTNYSDYMKYMVSNITIPNWMIDIEQIYMGGTQMMMPNGFQQGNLELTIYNTGIELQIMQNWLKETYDQDSRSYGYFDDVKGDLQVRQYTTDGQLAQTFWFTDCTIYQIGGISFSYDPASGPQTFTISLNYFGFTLNPSEINLNPSPVTKDSAALNSESAAQAAAAAKKSKLTPV